MNAIIMVEKKTIQILIIKTVQANNLGNNTQIDVIEQDTVYYSDKSNHLRCKHELIHTKEMKF